MSDDRVQFTDIAYARVNPDGTTIIGLVNTAIGCAVAKFGGPGSGLYDVTIAGPIPGQSATGGQPVADANLHVKVTIIGTVPRLYAVTSISDLVKRVAIQTAAGAPVDNAFSVGISEALA